MEKSFSIWGLVIFAAILTVTLLFKLEDVRGCLETSTSNGCKWL